MKASQSGTITFTTTHDTIASKPVSFSPPFKDTPVVVCSLSDPGPEKDYSYLVCGADDVSTNGFSATVKRFVGNPTTGPADGEVTLSWIALGQKKKS